MDKHSPVLVYCPSPLVFGGMEQEVDSSDWRKEESTPL